MRLRVFASGSRGNCLALRGAGRMFLVDLGLSCRELTKRMKACGLSPDEVAGVFFTHDHSDHCAGVATFHKNFPNVPLYANGNTADAIAALFELVRDINVALSSPEKPGKAALLQASRLFGELTDVLGLLYERKTEDLDSEIEALIEARTAARKAKNWAGKVFTGSARSINSRF